MSQLFNVTRLLILALIVAAAPLLHATPPTAASYSDEDLKQAGWTVEQIAELRAQTPQLLVKDDLDKHPDFGYSSIFKDYKSYDYLPEIDWSSANEKVGEIGGWRSYARQVLEAQRAERESEGDKQ